MHQANMGVSTGRGGSCALLRIIAIIIGLSVIAGGCLFAMAGCAAQPTGGTGATAASSESAGNAADSPESAAGPAIPSRPRAAVPSLDEEASEEIVAWLAECGFDASWVGDADSDLADYDCLVIPGGTADVTPSLYGQEQAPETKDCDLDFDNFQIALIQRFTDAGKPILGICRGAQILNVAFGGTLEQHIPGWHTKDRDITVNEQSLLYGLFGDEETVYHYHHQCVDELADGFIATQFDAQDGRIEAFRHETLPVYAVQWHPDSMDERGVEVMGVFREICLDNMREAALADAA